MAPSAGQAFSLRTMLQVPREERKTKAVKQAAGPPRSPSEVLGTAGGVVRCGAVRPAPSPAPFTPQGPREGARRSGPHGSVQGCLQSRISCIESASFHPGREPAFTPLRSGHQRSESERSWGSHSPASTLAHGA